MTEQEGTKKVLPPYIAYKTLRTFLENMKVAIPARIDRSLMRSMSGGTQSMLISALEYLKLISPVNGIPTDKLNRFVHSEGGEKQRVLKEILTASYPFLFKEDFDLNRATTHQLQECFSNIGTSGDTSRKCIAFFMAAAKEAGITMSPHIKARGPRVGSSKSKRKTQQPQSKLNDSVSEELMQPTAKIEWQQLLLSKFPSFDPAWPDDVKAKWFDGFKELMHFKKQFEN